MCGIFFPRKIQDFESKMAATIILDFTQFAITSHPIEILMPSLFVLYMVEVQYILDEGCVLKPLLNFTTEIFSLVKFHSVLKPSVKCRRRGLRDLVISQGFLRFFKNFTELDGGENPVKVLEQDFTVISQDRSFTPL